MTQALILGLLLGFFSGVVPGAFSALVAATALQRGFRAGLVIAVIPLLSEVLVLALTAALISQLPTEALKWMGLLGGALVLYLAWRTWGEAGKPPRTEPPGSSRKRLAEGVGLALLSPAPWVFWLLVGSPLFLAAWRDGWGAGLVFLGAFLLSLVGVHVALAGAAAVGHHRLSERWYRRLMRGASVALLIAGVVLIWQSWIGNFETMVAGSEAMRERVEQGMR